MPQALLLGSTTNKRFTGSQAAAVLGQLGITAAAYDLKTGCSTSLSSLHLAYALMGMGYHSILVAGAETLSKVIDPHNEKTWISLADGAAAVYLESHPQGRFVIEKSLFCTDGRFVDAFTTRAEFPPTTNQMDDPGYYLYGDEMLLKELAIKQYNLMLDAILPNKKAQSEITWIISHQVNKSLIKNVLERHCLHQKTLIWDAETIGNIGGASILYSLAQAFKNNVFNKKGKILLLSVGGGLSYAAQVIQVLPASSETFL